MTYEEFRDNYKKHHTCGIPFVPYELAFSNYCPKCFPDGPWEIDCKKEYESTLNDKSNQ